MAEKLDLEHNSPYRVAYELALMIARAEDKIDGPRVNGDRKYWLELYQRCRSVVVAGTTAEYALQQED